MFFLINVESIVGCSPLTWNQESKHKKPLIVNVGLKHEQIIIWRMKILATLLLIVFSNRTKKKYEQEQKSKKFIFVKFLAIANLKGKC
jgi:hypothetical protein